MCARFIRYAYALVPCDQHHCSVRIFLVKSNHWRMEALMRESFLDRMVNVRTQRDSSGRSASAERRQPGSDARLSSPELSSGWFEACQAERLAASTHRRTTVGNTSCPTAALNFRASPFIYSHTPLMAAHHFLQALELKAPLDSFFLTGLPVQMQFASTTTFYKMWRSHD